MSRTADQAHHLVADAHVVAADIEVALRALHDSRGGYPTSTSGAAPLEPAKPIEYGGKCTELGRHLRCGQQRPCVTHGDASDDESSGACKFLLSIDDDARCGHERPCPDHDTPVALTQPERDATTVDRARLDHIALVRELRRAATHAAKARAIVDRWANPADTKTAVARKLAKVDKSIWCRNCATHGVNNVSVPDRVDCKFCAEIRRTYGTPPNRALLEIHGYRTVTPQDVVRIFDRDVDGWRKTRPKPKAGKTRKGKAA